MPPALTAQQLRAIARDLGFDFCHVAPAERATHATFFERWIEAGTAGEMAYLEANAGKRVDPRRVESDAPTRTVIVLGVDYRQFDLAPEIQNDPSRGLIARYAWGDDYHLLMRPQLIALDRALAALTRRTARGRAFVDTGPVLERDWAQRAGLGFTGKNCCTIHPQAGSWLFLAALLVPELIEDDGMPAGSPLLIDPDLVLRGLPPETHAGAWRLPSDAAETGAAEATCGACTRCLSACPTDAFRGPFHLDAQRCIAYWTIEARAAIPVELRARFGNRIFGCDVCQDVCPWNARLEPRAPRLPGLRARDERIAPSLLEGFAPETPYWLDEAAFRTRFRRSPLLRPGRAGLLRNVCVALGNWGASEAIPALTTALHDQASVVRQHAAWGLGRVGQAATDGVRATVAYALRARQAPGGEFDHAVRDELATALRNCS
jgi:epoxyqueuosine reductase